jgi:general secretion pathway protein N
VRTERSLLQRFAQARPLTWLLAGVCGWALLLWLGALLGMGGRVAAVEPLPGSALPQPRPATPDRIGPLVQYAEAAARPLFTQDRRPRGFLASVPEGEGEAAQSQSLDFILTGVLISPQVRLATLQPASGGEAQRVREGSSPEGASGWRLLEVQPRRVVFEGSGGQVTLDLRTFGGSGPAPGAVARNAGDAMATAVPPPPPPPAADQAPQSEAARIETIRRRIEARRAQLRAGSPAGNAGNSSPPPSVTAPSSRE